MYSEEEGIHQLVFPSHLPMHRVFQRRTLRSLFTRLVYGKRGKCSCRMNKEFQLRIMYTKIEEWDQTLSKSREIGELEVKTSDDGGEREVRAFNFEEGKSAVA